MTYPSSKMTPFNMLDDHDDISETQFLKNSIINHTKYGSTNHNSTSKNYKYITHYVDHADTLQGLALKYGCKIENIKKFNKLYSDDNNHLRSRLSILIPIDNENDLVVDSNMPFAQSSQSSPSLTYKQISLDGVCNSTSSEDMTSSNKNNKQNSKKSLSLSDSSNFNSDKTNSESLADFLIRIDSSIARTKNNVEKFSKITEDNSVEKELNKISNKKFNTPKLSNDRNLFLSSTSNSIFDSNSPSLPRVSVNNKRKIKSTLKRLEKSQEEIFEL